VKHILRKTSDCQQHQSRHQTSEFRHVSLFSLWAY
jgi:hypothetical protein